MPSGAQWDEPFGWAPTNWLAVCGLEAYGFGADAERIADKFTATIDRSFAADGTIREKYNMRLGNADVQVTAGYSQNVVGFGWTNGVYLKLRELLAAGPIPAGPAPGKAVPAPTGGSEAGLKGCDERHAPRLPARHMVGALVGQGPAWRIACRTKPNWA